VRFYDITRPIRAGMPVWPGDPPVEIETALSLETDGVWVSRISVGTHTGTHVDAPAHIGGDGTLDDVPLAALCGAAQLVHWPHRRRIEAHDLAPLGVPTQCPRLLLRTGQAEGANETLSSDHATLTPEAAAELLTRGLRLFGTDAPSVDPDDAEEIHRLFLGRGIAIVKGLALAEVPPGSYQLYCLPLRLAGLDGAPARAILVAE